MLYQFLADLYKYNEKLNEVEAWFLTINLLTKQNKSNWPDVKKNIISLLSHF